MGRQPIIIPPRFRLYDFDTLPSTQILAKEWCALGQAKPGDVIRAAMQTASYGRRGRSWQSAPGNLLVTLIEELKIEQLPWLGYAFSLGLYDAVAKHLPDHGGVRLKWPNDVLIDKVKLAGMLLEVTETHLVIGLGVNIAHAPASDQPTTALNAHSHEPIDLNRFLSDILAFYESWWEMGQTQGFAGIRQVWLERAIWLGDTINAKLADGRVLSGHFIDIDETGALVLDVKGAHHTITSADIYIR